MSKEKFKTLILIILFLNSLVLIFVRFNFIEYFDFYGIRNGYSASVPVEIEDSIKPSQVIVRFGGNNLTKILSEKNIYYNQGKNIIKLGISGNGNLHTISQERYMQTKASKSIQFNFTSLDGKLLSRSFFLEKSIVDDLKGIKEILIPLVDENFIYIKTQTEHYRIPTPLPNKMDVVDNLSETDYLRYYSLDYIFDSTSHALVPVEFELSYKSYDTISSLGSGLGEDIARKIFKERYDFVNKTVEIDGSNIYTYNYGQELLKIRPTGYVEYLNESISAKESSVELSVVTAMEFLNSIGISLDQIIYEESEEITVKGRKGYKVMFSDVVEDLRVLSSSQRYDITVVIVGDNVYSFTGIRRSLLPYDFSTNVYLMGPLEVLNVQFNFLKERTNIENAIGLFNKIEEIELIYFMDQNYILIPSWRITIEDRDYIFNSYTGEILNYGLG